MFAMKIVVNTLSLAFLLSLLSNGISETIPLGVCDAMRQHQNLDGKIVRIRGEYVATFEIVGLYGNCDGRAILDGTPWPWAIHVTFANSSNSVEGLDPESLQSLRRVTAKPCPKCKRYVTLVGRFKSSGSNPAYLSSKGTPVHAGFGHLGVFGAEIETIAAENIVEETPQK